MTYLLSIHNNWFARQQSRRNLQTVVPSGVFMRFEDMITVFALILSQLFLYTVEIGQIAFVAAIVIITIAVFVKIIKNKKTKKKSQ
ncbi:MAG: hypothetical protein ACE5RL_01830 [Nitrosarchaeum sp.]